jgi:plasmid maintenance system antidote protein VapI
MIPKNRIPTHPGEVLQEEFLGPLEIPQTRVAAGARAADVA